MQPSPLSHSRTFYRPPPNPLPLVAIPYSSVSPAASSHESAVLVGLPALDVRSSRLLSPGRVSGSVDADAVAGVRAAEYVFHGMDVPRAVCLLTAGGRPGCFRSGPSPVRPAVTVARAGVAWTRVRLALGCVPPREWGCQVARWLQASVLFCGRISPRRSRPAPGLCPVLSWTPRPRPG